MAANGFDSSIIVKSKLMFVTHSPHKEGKTYFALTGPEPIYMLDIDGGVERAIENFRKKQVYVKRYRQEYIKVRYADDEPARSVIDAACDQLEHMKEDYQYSLKNGRTVIVDGATELYEIVRLAEFAKTERVQSFEYGPVNREMKWWCDQAKQSDANVIFTHKVTDEYISKERTGKQVMDGWKRMRGEGDVVLSHSIKESEPFPNFYIKVLRCGHNPEMNGSEFSVKDVDLPVLGSLILTKSKYSDWK